MALTLCNTLNKCVDADCDNLSVGGLQEVVVVYNLSDVSFTFDGTDKTKITAITPSAGKQGYTLEGTSMLFKGGVEAGLNEAGLMDYTHTVNGRILNASNNNTDLADRLGNSNLVAVTFGRNKVIEVYGVKSGMRVTMTKGTSENNGTWGYEMKTVDGYFEVKPLYTYIGGGGSFEVERDALLATISCP